MKDFNRYCLVALASGALAVFTACGSTDSNPASDPAPVVAPDPAPVSAPVPDADGSLHRHHVSVTVQNGGHPWGHWHHPDFDRPSYGWNWNHLKDVTCTAEDSHGDYYPIVQAGYSSQDFQRKVGEIEDSALDRCYAQSDRDGGCHLHDCQPGY